MQVVPNLVAGAIAEAGANQAGDMMQVVPLFELNKQRSEQQNLPPLTTIGCPENMKTAYLLGICTHRQQPLVAFGLQ